MHEPHSDPTAQQLKASLTACVCVCVFSWEKAQACCSDPVGLRWIWSLMLQLAHWQAVYCQLCACLWVIRAASHLDKKEEHTHKHTPTTVPMSVFSQHAHLLKRQKPPTTSSVRDLFQYQIFRASNIKGLSSEGNSTAAMHSSINSLLNMYFSDLWIKTLRDHTMRSSRIKR